MQSAREALLGSDAWLVSRHPQKTWDEVNEVLEGRIQGIQHSLIIRQGEVPSSIAASYRIERTLSGNTMRMLAYAELLDESRVVKESGIGYAEKARSDYANEAEMFNPRMRRSDLSKLKNDLWNSKYEPLVERGANSVREAEELEKLILRKAVLDFFSVKNNSTGESGPLILHIPKMIDEIESFLKPDEDGNNLSKRKPVQYFLNRLGSYLTETYDSQLFTQFSYRNSPDLITKAGDCIVLDTVLAFLTNPSSYFRFPEIEQSIVTLNHSFLEFLKHRASATSFTRETDSYPLLSLIYDLFLTGLYRGDLSILRNLSTVVDNHFHDIVGSSSLIDEMKSIRDDEAPLRLSAYSYLLDVAVRQSSLLLGPELSHDNIVNLLISPPHRITNGLFNLRQVMLEDPDKTFGKLSYVVDSIANLYYRANKNKPRDISPENEALLLEPISQIPIASIHAKYGIEIDLHESLNRILSLFRRRVQATFDQRDRSDEVIISPELFNREEKLAEIKRQFDKFHPRDSVRAIDKFLTCIRYRSGPTQGRRQSKLLEKMIFFGMKF